MKKKLMWKPVQNLESKAGGERLEKIISNRYELPYTLASSDCDYLKGLRDAGVDGAEDLLRAITMHAFIEIKSVEDFHD